VFAADYFVMYYVVKMKRSPVLYGLTGQGGRPLTEPEVDAMLMEKLVLSNIYTLTQHNLVCSWEPISLLRVLCLGFKIYIIITTNQYQSYYHSTA
jgi:hypothetical protein